MFSILKNIFPKYLKNILIFFPLLISNIYIDQKIIIDSIIGFFIFSLIVTIIYITNDFIDYNTDKNNKLKKKNNIRKFFSKNHIIILNLFFIPFFIILSYLNYFSIYLLLYLILFYLYTYFGKKIKLVDLLLLNSFYLIRLMYGCDIYNLKISFWFIIFFFTLFFILSIFKRYIQIKVNDRNKIQKIITYKYEDISMFKKLIFISLIINMSIFLIFIFQKELNIPHILSSETTYVNFNKFNYILVFFIYFTNIILLTKKVYNNKIKKDIFNYVATNKIIIISSISTIVIILIS